MVEVKKFPLRLKFSGNKVDELGLDLYDGSTSFQGFAQTLQIILHAYMSGEIVSRATALKDAEIYFGGPRRGSVIFDLITIVEKYPATTALFAGSAFYDFFKFTLLKAIGHLKAKPETPSVKKLLKQDETFFDHLAETIEGSLQRAHRAIDYGVS